MRLLIYGAYGYTGSLISREAAKRDMKTVIAGRDHEKVRRLGEELKLDYRVFSLKDQRLIESSLTDIDVVLHCAGPFTITGRPMIDSCIATGTHYIDITGEIEIFEYCREVSQIAEDNQVLLLPGAGFDIVPTDNLANMLIQKIDRAKSLEIAIYGQGKPSKGTSKSVIKVLSEGSRVIEGGNMITIPYGSRKFEYKFMGDKTRLCTPVPLPDLLSVTKLHEIENFTISYSVVPRALTLIKLLRPFIWFLRFRIVASFFRSITGAVVSNPADELRENTNSYIFGRVSNEESEIAIALKTPNAYDLTVLTALGAVDALEKMKEIQAGFRTPSEVLGVEYILTIPGVDISKQYPERNQS